MSQPIYKLYSNCILVKGAARSTICDLQRNRYHLVPNSFSQLLAGNGVIDPAKIYPLLEPGDQAIFHEYLEHLLQLELIFACDPLLAGHFSPISEIWDFPAYISNAVFDAYDQLDYCDKDLLDQLETLCCHYLQLRYYGTPDRTELQRIVDLVMPAPIKAIDLVLAADHQDKEQEQWLIQLVNTHRKIRCLTIHTAGRDEQLQGESFGFGTIIKIKEQVRNQTHCGVIHPAYFSVNMETYTESLAYNTCLNRKVAIDTAGIIKNCPGVQQGYGNIRSTRLADVVTLPEFQQSWHIRKDDIRKCRECEFRYICTDCRAYLEDPADIHSAPLKCGYDPYTCRWEKWSSNPLKAAVAGYYGIAVH